MSVQYRHSQVGYLMIVITLISIAAGALLYIYAMRELGIIFAIVGVINFLFGYKMTIEIRDNLLWFWFGVGLFWKKIPLEQIMYCEPYKGFIFGWGIHWGYSGWLYNVSGMKAVTVTLKSGKKIHIGTDEPQKLTEAINFAIRPIAKEEVSAIWTEIKTDYLARVEQALSAARHPRSFEILADVSSHLDQRFRELTQEEQTWENFQRIITEMGPPAEYTEFVGQPGNKEKPIVSAGYVIFLILILAAVTAVMIILPKFLKNQEAVTQHITVWRPFVTDPNLIGKWQSVDFVSNINDFTPGEKHWPEDLYLKEMIFFENGRTGGHWNWTKGEIFHPGSSISSHYYFKEMDGTTYLFFEWMSGDVTIRHMKPEYYVLKKLNNGER